MGQFRLSASKLKRFLTCPRAYFLRYVAGVEEDVGGSYLAIGTAYDLHVQHYLSAGARGVRSIDPRIVKMFDAARRYLPEPGSVEVQTKYSIPHPDGFVVEGTPDLRRPGWLGDTKTTSASGPGVGSAMTERQLADDIQFKLYAWCEYQLGYDGAAVAGVWSYVNKDTKPKAWNVRAEAWPRALENWFDRVVRPAARAMAALEAEADADRVLANLDSCSRCWTRAACSPYEGPNTYTEEDLAAVLDPAILRRCGQSPNLSTKPGSLCDSVVTTLGTVDITLTVDEASKSASSGAPTRHSLPIWDQGPDLVSLLSESITTLATRKRTVVGPRALSSTATCEPLSCPNGASSLESASLATATRQESVGMSISGSMLPEKPQPVPETLTSVSTESEQRSIFPDGEVSHVIVESISPVSPAEEDSQVPFDLSKLSVEEESVESVEVPINPPKPAPAVDYAAELAEAIAQCQSAAARAAGLLARLRGGS